MVAGGFVILSVDETAQIHERIGDKVSHLGDVSFLPDLYSWVLVVAPIALLGALWMISRMRSTVGMRSPTARLAVPAVAMWAVVPVPESLDPTLGGPDLRMVIEETLETAGATTFLAGMLLYLSDRDGCACRRRLTAAEGTPGGRILDARRPLEARRRTANPPALGEPSTPPAHWRLRAILRSPSVR